MPADVDENLRRQGFLKSVGPHAPGMVRRRLANWSTLTNWRGLDGAFTSPALKPAIHLAVRAVPRTRRRKSAKAVTSDVLAKLLATCATDSLRDLRDRAILMVASAPGRHRRSEAGLRCEQLTVEPPIEIPDAPPLPSLAIHLGRTKSTTGEQDEIVYLTGRPVEALNAWMVAAKIESGSVFRSIGRWGTVPKRAIDPQSVNAILKQRAAIAGLEPGDFSAHGLRSGYLTEAANRGIPLPEATEQSRHRSEQQASSYYNHATRWSGKAARLLSCANGAPINERVRPQPFSAQANLRLWLLAALTSPWLLPRPLHTERPLARSSKIIRYCDAGIENAKHRLRSPNHMPFLGALSPGISRPIAYVLCPESRVTPEGSLRHLRKSPRPRLPHNPYRHRSEGTQRRYSARATRRSR